jgi:hypothetical protein
VLLPSATTSQENPDVQFDITRWLRSSPTAAIGQYERVYEMVKSLELLLERQPDNPLSQRRSYPATSR